MPMTKKKERTINAVCRLIQRGRCTLDTADRLLTERAGLNPFSVWLVLCAWYRALNDKIYRDFVIVSVRDGETWQPALMMAGQEGDLRIVIPIDSPDVSIWALPSQILIKTDFKITHEIRNLIDSRLN